MPIEAYGATFQDGSSEAVIELAMAFNAEDGSGARLSSASGFLGHYEHLHKAIDAIWNREGEFFIWNEWSELLMKGFIENRESPVTGPSSSWKTTCLGCYIVCFWLADPLNSKVIPSSTSLGGLRERIWKDVLKFYKTCGASFGNIINHPHPKIQTVKGDDSSGIHGIAVEQGDVDSAIDKIKGRHAPNVLIAIDEGTGAQPAIVEACVNLSTGCLRYQLIMLANAGSYFDEHGKLSEPENGWGSVSVDSTTWKTKRGGLAIHLDGHKAPNVLAGYRKYPGMIAQEDLDVAARQYGENSPRYWQERRGFWAPEGMSKTVLTESIIEKFHARDKAIWVDSPIMVGSLDPAYGGDRCVLRFGKVGLIDDKGVRRRALELTDYFCLKLDVTSKDPVDYQIAKQVREECKARGVEADNFAMDASGAGRGVAAIFKREWTMSGVYEVIFGGNASDRRISDINPRLGHQEFVNKVSELWFQFRAAVERGQIRGMDVETCKEFCMRKVDHEKWAPRSRVESKTEMKGLQGRSPDLADAAVVLLELVLVRGLLPSDTIQDPTGKTRDQQWVDFARTMMPKAQYAT